MGFCQCKHPKPILLQDAQCSFGTRSRTASWLRPLAEWMAKGTTNSSFPRTWKSLFNKEKHPLQSLAWLNLPSGHPFGWAYKFAPNHGFTVHSTNGLLVIFVLSLQGESLCHSDTNLNRLAPRFGTVLLVFKILRYHTAGAYGSIWNMKKVIIPAYVIVWPT